MVTAAQKRIDLLMCGYARCREHSLVERNWGFFCALFIQNSEFAPRQAGRFCDMVFASQSGEAVVGACRGWEREAALIRIIVCRIVVAGKLGHNGALVFLFYR